MSGKRKARFFIFHLTYYADGPHHYHHPSCGHEGRIFSSLPRFTPYDFLSRCKFSTLTTLINQWLDFIYSRSHAFRYRKKEQKSCLTRIELTTSALFFFFLFSSLISLIIADGPHHYHHPSCGHEGRIFSSLPRFTPYDFLSRCKFSTLTTLINQWLDFIYSRSHAFRYRKK